MLLNQLGFVACTCRLTNGYIIKTMYVYYIIMEIYVLVYTNILSPFLFCIYNYYVISFSCHGFHTIMQKIFENKISIIFTILFHKTLHSYNNLFSWSEGVFKGHKHSFILVTKMKLNKKFPNVYISHGFQCDSTCTLMWQKLFISIIMCESMHIN